MGLWDKVTKITRRALTGAPSSITSDAHNAWLQEQIKVYSTQLPYVGPHSLRENLTHETGEMRLAYRTMLREPAIFAPLMAKTFAVASLDPQINAEDDDNPKHREAAAWVKYAIERSEGGWPRLLMNILLPGQMDGFSVTEKVYGHMPTDHAKYPGWWTIKAAKDKDTTNIKFKIDEYKTVLAVQALGASNSATPMDPRDFILFTHLSIFQSPFGLSALRPVYRAQQLIIAAIKLRSLLLENFSGPFLTLKYGDTTKIQAAKAALEQARARGYIVLGKEDELQVLNLATTAPDQFQNAIEDLRKECSLGLRGAYLQSLESSSPQGNSNTHKSQTELFDWYLTTTVCSVINTQLIPDLVEPNYGMMGGMPTLSLGGLDPQAVMMELQKFKQLQELGVDLSVSQIRKVAGAESPKDDADKLQKPGGAMGGMPGMPSPAPSPAGDPFSLDDGMDGQEPDAEFTELFADRSHLVKVKKQDKNGVMRTVYVKPSEAQAMAKEGKAEPQPKAEPKAQEKPAEDKPKLGRAKAGPAADKAKADAVAILTSSKSVGVDGLKQLAEHLSKLPAASLKELQAEHGLKGGKVKQDHVDRLVAFASGRESGMMTSPEQVAIPPLRPNGTPAKTSVKDVFTVDPKNLNTDPQRFQYKTVGIGQDGVTDELRGTKTYNPELGGVLLAWRDPADGKDYIVNGHHRHELASRTGAAGINVRYVEAENAQQARAKGALANIAEGRGTATDAAKFMRDTGTSPDEMKQYGVSMSGKVAADALSLRDLGDKAFQKLTTGDLKESTAVAVAKHLKDQSLQDKLFKRLEDREADGKDWSGREIETAAKMMANAGKVSVSSGATLFGEWEDEESTFDQEVELRSHIAGVLNKTTNDYHAVSNAGRAERVAEAGNVLSVDENVKRRDKARADAEEFDQQSGLRGPVADAIREGAAELAKAKTKKDKDNAKRNTLERVQGIISGQPAQVERSGQSSPEKVDAKTDTSNGDGYKTDRSNGGSRRGEESQGSTVKDTRPARSKSEPTKATSTPSSQSAVDGIKSLTPLFRQGNVPRETVEAELTRLDKLSAAELLDVAKQVNADATLTAKSSASKIRKQIKDSVLQVWRTSDNVNH
jgi:hypothetical protein